MLYGYPTMTTVIVKVKDYETLMSYKHSEDQKNNCLFKHSINYVLLLYNNEVDYTNNTYHT